MPCAKPVIVVKNDIRKKKIFQPIEITSSILYIWISVEQLKLSRKKAAEAITEAITWEIWRFSNYMRFQSFPV